MEYQKLSGKDLDNWAEARGIKRYQGFLFPDSDERFKEEITKSLPSNFEKNDGFITFDLNGYEIHARLVLVDQEGDFIFELHPDHTALKSVIPGCFPAKSIKTTDFWERYPKLSDSFIFYILRDDITELDKYMGAGYAYKLLSMESIDWIL